MLCFGGWNSHIYFLPSHSRLGGSNKINRSEKSFQNIFRWQALTWILTKSDGNWRLWNGSIFSTHSSWHINKEQRTYETSSFVFLFDLVEVALGALYKFLYRMKETVESLPMYRFFHLYQILCRRKLDSKNGRNTRCPKIRFIFKIIIKKKNKGDVY